MAKQMIAAVTGGNKGLGLSTCRKLAEKGYNVILTSRDDQKGQDAVTQLNAEGFLINFLQLDVADPKSIANFYQQIVEQWGRLDVLVNNAGVLLDEENDTSKYKDFEKLIDHRRAIFEETLKVNVTGIYELCERMIPLMLKHNYGRIVNVSSEAGKLSSPHSYYLAYSVSKTALNGLTCFLGERLKGTNVLINSICPGWVKTDMGGPNAPRSLEEGIKGIIWAATLQKDGPNGGFFRDGKPLDW